jgi:hypothetical protein
MPKGLEQLLTTTFVSSAEQRKALGPAIYFLAKNWVPEGARDVSNNRREEQ